MAIFVLYEKNDTINKFISLSVFYPLHVLICFFLYIQIDATSTQKPVQIFDGSKRYNIGGIIVIFAWPWKNQNQDNTQTNWRGDRSRETQCVVLTGIYLSLLVSTIQWNLEFSETDQSDQCDGVSLAVSAGSIADCEFRLLFSALNYWMSLLFTLLLLRIKKIKWRRRQCYVWLRRLTNFREWETAFIVPAQQVCIESIQARGNRDLFLYFCS